MKVLNKSDTHIDISFTLEECKELVRILSEEPLMSNPLIISMIGDMMDFKERCNGH